MNPWSTAWGKRPTQSKLDAWQRTTPPGRKPQFVEGQLTVVSGIQLTRGRGGAGDLVGLHNPVWIGVEDGEERRHAAGMPRAGRVAESDWG